MALRVTYNLTGEAYVQGINGFVMVKKDLNLSIDNSYVKITSLTGNKTKIQLNIGIYDTKNGNLVATDYYEFIPDVSSESNNFIQQGYEQLKANKYIGAIDVLEEGQTT